MKHVIIVAMFNGNIPDAIAAIAPLIGIALFALPSYIGVLKQKKFMGLIILLALGVYALAIETFAIKTGLLYGKFTYTDTLGPRILETTPYVVALAYPPILLFGFWLASKFTRSGARVVIAAVLATLVDVVLDPATVKLQFWEWETPGPFYGVPIINFVGWLISGLIGAAILHSLWGKDMRVKAPVAYSGLAILLFWSGVNAGVNQMVPFVVGVVYSIAVIVIIFLEKQQFKNEE